MGVTKRELVKRVAQALDLSERQTGQVVQHFLDAVIEVLIEHRRLELRNFGVFEVVKHKEKTVHHPVTGKPAHLPSHQVIGFKAGKHVKERLNGYFTR
ncbi:MAG: HU family DNA-binding protein [Candidatus Tectomicrobia bacterium]|nr:HU family DNA-binding protein [Candidatus Tectomicrobia bacterium]